MNTAQSRFYQSFVTRFNVYHNGHEAYKEGLDAQEKAHKDNYMEIIPLFIIVAFGAALITLNILSIGFTM